MMGNGALCPELIKAHSAVRPIKNVKIWGQNKNNAEKTVEENNWDGLKVSVSENIENDMGWADIISCATSTFQSIVFGEFIKKGTHIDLVGSYKPDMREADDELIKKAKIYIDNEAAKKECGDIFIPLKSNIIHEKAIKGTLADLVNKTREGRTSENEITLFKSVGFALEDLAAAEYLFEKQNGKRSD